MKVLLIPEDFRHDQYILSPIFKRIFASVGKPNAKIRTCTDPLLGGVSEAMKPERLEEIFEQYNGMVDIFILCVDRDADVNREARLQALENRFNVNGRTFLAVAAREELEVWALAGLADDELKPFAAIRGHPHPKEHFFEPYARKHGYQSSIGYGRKILATKSAANFERLISRCPEDLGLLRNRVLGLV